MTVVAFSSSQKSRART